MKNEAVWASYREYTIELTKHARQMGFAGIAVCWLFREPGGDMSLPVVGALGLLTLFFVADAAQYLVGAVQLKRWMESEEERFQNIRGTIEGDYAIPKALDRPTFALWSLKLVLLLVGFGLLGVEAVRQMVDL